jgi:hypothetical protein
MVQLCIAGFSPGRLNLTVETPDGVVHASEILVGDQTDLNRLVEGPMTGARVLGAADVSYHSDIEANVFQTETWFIDETVRSGRYRLAVEQGSLLASGEYTVGPADVPGIRSVSEGIDEGTLVFALYGYLPGELVPVAIFAFVGEATDGGYMYEMVAELVPVEVDDRGFRKILVDVGALGVPPNPYADSFRDLCLISAGVDPQGSNVQCAMGRSRRPSSGFRGLPQPSFEPDRVVAEPTTTAARRSPRPKGASRTESSHLHPLVVPESRKPARTSHQSMGVIGGRPQCRRCS